MSSGKDYIPRAHDTFRVWEDNFYTRISEKLASYKIDAEELEPVTAAKSKYELAFDRAKTPQANTADRIDRNEREKTLKTAIREFVNANLRFNPRVSDGDRQTLGLTVPDTKPTPHPAPATRPVLTVDFSETQRHTLHIKNEGSVSKQFPVGAHLCEIFGKTGGAPPETDTDFVLLGAATKSTCVINYDASKVGQIAYYKARWVGTKETCSPFSTLVRATVA